MASDEQCEQVVTYLNELLAGDPAAISALIGLRVPVNAVILHHETCQVWQVSESSGLIGFLGVLNGLLQRLKIEQVCAVYEDSDLNSAVRFEQFDPAVRLVHKAKNHRQRKANGEADRPDEVNDSRTRKTGRKPAKKRR